ncbi:MAG: hypothetical protein RL095_2533 [Verrucomicrobiota bacterium]|jgi:hypothetical protein
MGNFTEFIVSVYDEDVKVKDFIDSKFEVTKNRAK